MKISYKDSHRSGLFESLIFKQNELLIQRLWPTITLTLTFGSKPKNRPLIAPANPNWLPSPTSTKSPREKWHDGGGALSPSMTLS